MPGQLQRLSNWILDHTVSDPLITVWAKPAVFDIPIIESAYRRVNKPVPWGFRATRCLREYRASRPGLAYPKRSKDLVKHHAGDDAMYQAECHIAWMRTCEGKIR
ncbi:MAG: 3'-5' exoribonuclease [Rhodobacteraceae bacterium]|nr:3'-5' exoribonuclease [Paracoccaceae bacterium]